MTVSQEKAFGTGNTALMACLQTTYAARRLSTNQCDIRHCVIHPNMNDSWCVIQASEVMLLRPEQYLLSRNLRFYAEGRYAN